MTASGQEIVDRAKRVLALNQEQMNNLIVLWEQFITQFKLDPHAQVGYYFQIISEMEKKEVATLTINYDHVRAFTHHSDPDVVQTRSRLTNTILANYDAATKTALIAFRDVLKELNPDYAAKTDPRRIVAFSNLPINMEIPDLKDEHLGKPITIEGLVINMDEPKVYVSHPVYKCSGGHANEVESQGTMHIKPSSCFTGEKCNRPMMPQPDDRLSTTDSFQMIRIQQRMDKVRPGGIPAIIDVQMVGRDRINLVKPGDFVTVSGIVRMRMSDKKQTNSLGTFYIEGTSLESKDDDMAYEDPLLMEKVKVAVRPSHSNQDFEKLVRSIAPSIKGHWYVKLACLLLLAGSDSYKMKIDGSRKRGDIQLFFHGDSSTGKTKISRYMLRVFFRAVLNSGRGSTQAGLTLAVSTDPYTGTKRLEIGTYPLASSKQGGVVVFDELEKTDLKERQILAELMDDEQTTSKHAAGFNVTLQLHCASIHNSNPILKENDGKYDRTMTLFQNSGIDAWLLSRYDAVFVFTDEADEKEDAAKATHWLNHYGSAVREDEWTMGSGEDVTLEDESYHPVAFMRYWGHYVRQTFHPKLDPSSEAGLKLKEFYLKMRKNSGTSGMRVTMRDLGGLIRFAEASARAHHRDTVEMVDVDIATDIIRTAMATSGFNPATGEAVALNVPVPAANGRQAATMKAQKYIAFITAVNGLTKQECDACAGQGYTVISTDSVYGENRLDCEKCAGAGYGDIRRFDGAELNRVLSKKMTADEVYVILQELQSRTIIMFSGNNSYTKIPNAWIEWSNHYVPVGG